MYNSFASQNQYFHPKNTPGLRYVFDFKPKSFNNLAHLQSQLRNLGLISTGAFIQKSILPYPDQYAIDPVNKPYNQKASEFFNKINLSVAYKNILTQTLPHLSKTQQYKAYANSHENVFGRRKLTSLTSPRSLEFSYLKPQDALIEDLALTNYNSRFIQDTTQQKSSNELRNWLSSFGAGFCAGTIARTSTAPLDRLKFIYQLYYKGSDKPPSLSKGFQEMYRRDGFRGLFRGNLVCVLKASPETSIRLTIFEKLKSLIKDEETGKLSKEKLFFAGGLSGALANFAIFPMDMLRTRLAGAPSGVYKGIGDAIRKISRTEGRIRPFYRGLSAGLIANFPTSGTNLMVYEALKEFVAYKGDMKNPPAVVYMVLAGLSAFVTCSALYPLQVVASRQIMQTLLDKENSGKGMMHQIKKTYKAEGIRGFYKGYCPATSKVVLGNAMSFGSYEIMKKAFGIEFKKH